MNERERPSLSEDIEALADRVRDRTDRFFRRGFWTRVWEAISGQHYRGLVVFVENQTDMLQMMEIGAKLPIVIVDELNQPGAKE